MRNNIFFLLFLLSFFITTSSNASGISWPTSPSIQLFNCGAGTGVASTTDTPMGTCISNGLIAAINNDTNHYYAYTSSVDANNGASSGGISCNYTSATGSFTGTRSGGCLTYTRGNIGCDAGYHSYNSACYKDTVANATCSGTTCTCASGFSPDSTSQFCQAAGVCPSAGLHDASYGKFVSTSASASTACVNGCGYNLSATICSADGICSSFVGGSTGATCTGTFSSSPAADIAASSVLATGGSAASAVAAAAAVAAAVAAASVSATTAAAAATAAIAAASAASAACLASGCTASAAAAAATAASASAYQGALINPPLTIPADLAKTGDIQAQTTSLNSKLDELKLPWDSINSKFGNAPGNDTIPTDTPTFNANPVTFSNNNTCPEPINFSISLPMLTHTYALSFQPFCDMAAMVKPIFVALAAITAAFIFAAGLTI